MPQHLREKLIRDGIPALAQAQGRTLAVRQASTDELSRLLGLKLVEETHEVLDAIEGGTGAEVLEELADLHTVIEAVALRYGHTLDDVVRRAAQKATERGGFSQGLVLRETALQRSRLHTGGNHTLLNAIKREFEACSVARIAVAFVMRSGLELLEGAALAAMLRGAQFKLLTTDYLGVTEPEALQRLTTWQGNFDARIYSHQRRSFHPKAYLFERHDGSGRAFIGSANLSRSGLVEGVEWTWTVLDVDAGQPMHELTVRFEELFEGEHVQAITPEWINLYAERRSLQVPVLHVAEPSVPYVVPPLVPREVQRVALLELERLRVDGQTRALVVAATGLGKTVLAAFDARDADRVLFIAHREELLKQAEASFKRLYPERSSGYVLDGRMELARDMVFASIQTLSRSLASHETELARFDYVVIDEFHHAAADSYQKVLAELAPKFLLGLTATPYRSDNRDILQLCDGNLAYQVGLFEAIGFGWLVPFRYLGVADIVSYSDDLLNTRKVYDTTKLTLRYNTEERALFVIDKYRQQPSLATLGFCVSIAHADFMAQRFNAAGIPSAAVHSGPYSVERAQAIAQLAHGELRVLFTVDLFNEGVDIPAVDLVMFLRPTESMTIFLQQLGRGLRLHPGKQHLTVLDFIGNYRNAHVKLPLLVGQDPTGDQDARAALQILNRWIKEGVRPDAVPEGVSIEFEPVALSAIRESLQKASPLKQLVLAELEELRASLGGPPKLQEWERLARYSLKTAKTALQVDRWNRVLAAAGMLQPQEEALDAQVGEFLKQIESTPMTKSFKMVVLLAMLDEHGFRHRVTIQAMVATFREYFSQERHRADVMGSPVEDPPSASSEAWAAYLEGNPIAAWTTANTQVTVPYFSYNRAQGEFRYVGPAPEATNASAFAEALLDRVIARLDGYWRRVSARNMVYAVVPTGTRSDVEDVEDRSYCIMLGDDRSGMPMGWHLVSINGKTLYAKFVKVAINVLKASASDDRSVPNVLTQELIKLLGDRLSGRARVRITKDATAAMWIITAV